jgi:hypothetical protein
MPYFTPPQDPGYIGDRRRGAGLGRASHSTYTDKEGRTFEITVTPDAAPFTLRRVRMVGYGDYDAGGAYWGCGDPLYYYEGPLTDIKGYVRGKTRDAAKAAVRKLHPAARFHR